MDCGKPPSGVRKVKKKQAKDELDRIKQAEKKKRRLEKALATSAAIISELEKKKQKQKEEQQRLDEEGAAIAEAVALQVLSGEDSDDTSCRQVMMEKDGESSRTSDLNVFPYRYQLYGNPKEEFWWMVNAHGGSRCQWSEYGVEGAYVDEMGRIAVEAVSALQIADDGDINGFAFNRMVRG